MTTPAFRPIDEIRADFPGLPPEVAALDGAAGTLVPSAVVEAVADALRHSMANLGGAFTGSERSDETVAAARRAIADLVGGDEHGSLRAEHDDAHVPDGRHTSRRTGEPGDEIVVTSLDHDANVRPWMLAAGARSAQQSAGRVRP